MFGQTDQFHTALGAGLAVTRLPVGQVDGSWWISWVSTGPAVRRPALGDPDDALDDPRRDVGAGPALPWRRTRVPPRRRRGGGHGAAASGCLRPADETEIVITMRLDPSGPVSVRYTAEDGEVQEETLDLDLDLGPA